jgi:hypothetical protein
MKYDVILPNHKFEKLQKLANFNKSQIKKEVSNQKKLIIAKYQNMLDAKDNEVLSLEDALLNREKQVEYFESECIKADQNITSLTDINNKLSNENSQLYSQVTEIDLVRANLILSRVSVWALIISFILSIIFSKEISNSLF